MSEDRASRFSINSTDEVKFLDKNGNEISLEELRKRRAVPAKTKPAAVVAKQDK